MTNTNEMIAGKSALRENFLIEAAHSTTHSPVLEIVAYQCGYAVEVFVPQMRGDDQAVGMYCVGPDLGGGWRAIKVREDILEVLHDLGNGCGDMDAILGEMEGNSFLTRELAELVRWDAAVDAVSMGATVETRVEPMSFNVDADCINMSNGSRDLLDLDDDDRTGDGFVITNGGQTHHTDSLREALDRGVLVGMGAKKKKIKKTAAAKKNSVKRKKVK